ncbi:NADPH-dependent FMN reductase [Salininema proteolyticum]|uniref:NADPH-dependent FMN reductase n=1 Tax=Salininema proteolyticum TaxID=1607685 RepID=A0ABV8U5A5_9ACTN
MSADEKIRIAVIIGSVRTDRFCPTPARWFAGLAGSRDDVEVDLIDLAELEIPTVLGGDDPEWRTPRPVEELGRRLEAADAFTVVTPVYNRSYPASLKNAVDWFYGEWVLKPVAFVSYGGITGGLQSIDHLRGVFTEFNAVPLRDSIMFPNFWKTFDEEGRVAGDPGADSRASNLVDQLHWWAVSLKEARAARKYPEAAGE